MWSVLTDLSPAFGTALAALVGVGLWLLQSRHARRIDERQRVEQVRGMLVALRAEIDVSVERLSESFAADRLEEHLAHFREAVAENEARARANPQEAQSSKPKVMPIAPADSTNFVFDDLKKEFRLLPDSIIALVVRYYQYDLKLTVVTNAFSSGAYNGISPARQARAIGNYVKLGTITLREAEAALDGITAHLSGTGDRRLDGRNDRTGHG